MSPRFFYFDLGNVLVTFDFRIACRQIAELARVSADRAQAIVYDSGLHATFERGDVSQREFYQIFCARSGTAPEYEPFLRAATEMFEINEPVVAIATELHATGRRIGILSNTVDMHWRYCTTGRFARIGALCEVAALSYRLRLMKPAPAMYQAAAALAGVAPPDVFFVDDRADNVQGAERVGFDAVQFISPAALREVLAQRGVNLPAK
jgi:putative hydrolase of the HAD superfamily